MADTEAAPVVVPAPADAAGNYSDKVIKWIKEYILIVIFVSFFSLAEAKKGGPVRWIFHNSWIIAKENSLIH